MNIADTIKKLERIDALIAMKATGTPEQLAKKLGCSIRSLHNHLNHLKLLGEPICFCKIRKCYYYKEPGKFNFRFVVMQ